MCTKLLSKFMAKFKPNFEFEKHLEIAFKDIVYAIFYASQLVINTERYWDGWETSNPNRDIVDTAKLRDSGKVEFISNRKAVISWSTAYVFFVYFGYTLKDGRRIPARKWIHIAIDENNFPLLFINALLNS